MSNRAEAHSKYAQDVLEVVGQEATTGHIFKTVINMFDGQPYCKTYKNYTAIASRVKRMIKGVQHDD